MKQPTLIMIHGFRGTHHGLQRIADHLGEFQLRVPDLPGFAEGDHLDEYTLDSYVAWLHEYIQKQKLTELPFLLGHSFGSIVCAAYAAKYPDTIKKLILVNPIGAPALEGPRGALSKIAVAYYWLGKKLPKPVAHAWLASKASTMVMSNVMAKTKNADTRQWIHQQHLQYFSLFHSPSSVYDGFVTSVSNSVRDVAKQITTPTLLIVGELDDITPLEKQKLLQKEFPSASLVIIKDVGHLTHYETPDQVADAVQDFIKSE